MSETPGPDLYFSFFMFTADLRPDDPSYTRRIVAHVKALRDMGYAGFDLPVAPVTAGAATHQAEVDLYKRLRDALDKDGVGDVRVTTNVGATPTYDPSSAFGGVRAAALEYLKSRVDITKALGGEIMAGPVVLPYGAFPAADGRPLWSDDLQDWVAARYAAARPVLQQLGDYAAGKNVKVAIEPVDHWETAPPNLVGDVLGFLDGVASRQVGVCIDSAHVALGSDGMGAFAAQVRQAAAAGRIHYVHLSALDRGAVHDSWIPWGPFLGPIRAAYSGPYLVEVFNAIPVFLNSLRLTRRKFLIPGEDAPVPGRPDAYEVARLALAEVRRQFAAVASPACSGA